MKKSLSKLEKEFSEGLIQLIWDQWISIGLAGSASFGKVPFAIDPEALLLATTVFWDEEPRLRAEVLDWLTKNEKLISLQRIKNTFRVKYENSDALVDIAEFLSRSSFKNWASIQKLKRENTEIEEGKETREEPLLRGLSQSPNPMHHEAFFFKMRALFGMSARAEIIAWLMAHERGYPAKIAHETGWISKTAQTVLNELEYSGHIFKTTKGRKSIFGIDPSEWEFLVPKGRESGGWLNQPSFYNACFGIKKVLSGIAEPTMSDAFRSVLISDFLSLIVNNFESVGGRLEEPFAKMNRLRGSDLVTAFTAEVERLSNEVIIGRNFPVTKFS